MEIFVTDCTYEQRSNKHKSGSILIIDRNDEKSEYKLKHSITSISSFESSIGTETHVITPLLPLISSVSTKWLHVGLGRHFRY